MKSSVSLNQINKIISRFMHRYHVILFSVIALGGVILATIILNNVVISSEATDAAAPYSGFDKDTIEKLESLNMPSEANALPPIDVLRGSRNPFVE